MEERGDYFGEYKERDDYLSRYLDNYIRKRKYLDEDEDFEGPNFVALLLAVSWTLTIVSLVFVVALARHL